MNLRPPLPEISIPLAIILICLARVRLRSLATRLLALVTARVVLAFDGGVVAVVGVGCLKDEMLEHMRSAEVISRHVRIGTNHVAQVRVDSHQFSTVGGRDTLHVNSAGAVIDAVSARAVDLAVVFGVEVVDLYQVSTLHANT